MSLVAAVNSDWGIGYNNAQSVVLPEDRQNFQKLTSGSHVIVGRKTFEGFGRPLPESKNIILTHDRMFKVAGTISAHSVDEVLALIADEDADKVFIIGGGAIYKQFLPMCSCAYITKIDTEPPSDTYFPNLDKLPDWSLESSGDVNESGGVRYSFNLYKNNVVIGAQCTL